MFINNIFICMCVCVLVSVCVPYCVRARASERVGRGGGGGVCRGGCLWSIYQLAQWSTRHKQAAQHLSTLSRPGLGLPVFQGEAGGGLLGVPTRN